jgi:hypothetical protein
MMSFYLLIHFDDKDDKFAFDVKSAIYQKNCMVEIITNGGSFAYLSPIY